MRSQSKTMETTKSHVHELGLQGDPQTILTENGFKELRLGRITTRHREGYVVRTDVGTFEAELLGTFRYSVSEKTDFPAVGDWVAIQTHGDEVALIHGIIPRKTALIRKAIGKVSEAQIVASNIDCAFIVQTANRDISINRLERYLSICHESKITPILILNKIDLLTEEDITEIRQTMKTRLPQLQFFTMSNKSGAGIKEFIDSLKPQTTYCLLGSSGVGKSTLVNTLAGTELMKTGDISIFSDRGKHVTTQREMHILPGGSIFIDNPGVREVGVAEVSRGLDETFTEIIEISQCCKFRNCTHQNEKGCAITEAIEKGEITLEQLDNFIKLSREKELFSSSVAERKKKGKAPVKVIKKHIKKKKR